MFRFTIDIHTNDDISKISYQKMVIIKNSDKNKDFKYRSDHTHLGSNSNSIVFRSESNEGFLLSIRSNQSIDRQGFNFMNFIKSFFNLNFVGSSVNNESKGISFSHHFVRFLSVKGMSQN